MTGGTPKISVIVPAYNAALYIDQTLKSIMSQSYKAFEVIVVDDGSTDETVQIVQKYPVILLRQPNQGPSAARNLGVARASGDWIAFIDGDDYWVQEKLEKVIEFLARNPLIEFISTNLKRGNDQQGWIPIDFSSKFESDRNFVSQIFRRNFIATSTVVLKKSRFVEAGGFNKNLKIAEDLDLWIRLASIGIQYAPLGEFLTFYRAHGDSTTVNLLRTLALTKNVLFSHADKVNFPQLISSIQALNLNFVRFALKTNQFKNALLISGIVFMDAVKMIFLYFKPNSIRNIE